MKRHFKAHNDMEVFSRSFSQVCGGFRLSVIVATCLCFESPPNLKSLWLGTVQFDSSTAASGLPEPLRDVSVQEQVVLHKSQAKQARSSVSYFSGTARLTVLLKQRKDMDRKGLSFQGCSCECFFSWPSKSQPIF